MVHSGAKLINQGERVQNWFKSKYNHMPVEPICFLLLFFNKRVNLIPLTQSTHNTLTTAKTHIYTHTLFSLSPTS